MNSPKLYLYSNVTTERESHNAQRYRQTDGRTDDMIMPIAEHIEYQYDRLKTTSKTTYIADIKPFLQLHV